MAIRDSLNWRKRGEIWRRTHPLLNVILWMSIPVICVIGYLIGGWAGAVVGLILSLAAQFAGRYSVREHKINTEYGHG